MPKGGIRPRALDGSLNHLLKPKWKSGKTQTIRVPVIIANQLVEVAHKLDEGKLIDLTQDKATDEQRLKATVLLEKAITPKSKGGSYAANNATAMKKLVEQALVLLDKS